MATNPMCACGRGSDNGNCGSMPAGTYRVINGALYRIEPGLPPSLDPERLALEAVARAAEDAAKECDSSCASMGYGDTDDRLDCTCSHGPIRLALQALREARR